MQTLLCVFHILRNSLTQTFSYFNYDVNDVISQVNATLLCIVNSKASHATFVHYDVKAVIS